MTGLCVLMAAVYAVAVSGTANSYELIVRYPWVLALLIPAFIACNVFAGFGTLPTRVKKRRVCYHGALLLCAFYVSVVVSVAYQLWLAVRYLPENPWPFVYGLLLCIGVNALIFWNGIICVYLTSAQLGIKLRLLGVLFGMIPPINLIVLFFIVKTCLAECLFETKKDRLNEARHDQRVCETKYPLLLVHGVFFRDTKYFNYWGRIPKELECNGATVFYGNHGSAAAVADSAAELKARIEEICRETGAEKVNIIAHSKGGLDCRFAMAKLGVAERVASLTTVNTPHTGCLFADYLLTKIPTPVQQRVAATYNAALAAFGEKNADFMAAVNDLTDAGCRPRHAEMPTPEGVLCQSVGSVMPKAAGGSFPLNFSYRLVKHFSGENDGLVSEDAFEWGERYTLLRPSGRRGISHGDMIDLNRKNIPGFDVREFYVQLVSELKDQGL